MVAVDEPVARREVTVVNGLGLHARAASLFVRTTRRFDSAVEVRCGDRVADGRSIVGLLTLAASNGRSLEITTRGHDAEAALAALAELVEGGLGEPGRDS